MLRTAASGARSGPDCLLQQDSLASDSELSHYFAQDAPGPLSDFLVAGSEDEDHTGSGCSTSEDGSLPPGTPGELRLYPPGLSGSRITVLRQETRPSGSRLSALAAFGVHSRRTQPAADGQPRAPAATGWALSLCGLVREAEPAALGCCAPGRALGSVVPNQHRQPDGLGFRGTTAGHQGPCLPRPSLSSLDKAMGGGFRPWGRQTLDLVASLLRTLGEGRLLWAVPPSQASASKVSLPPHCTADVRAGKCPVRGPAGDSRPGCYWERLMSFLVSGGDTSRRRPVRFLTTLNKTRRVHRPARAPFPFDGGICS